MASRICDLIARYNVGEVAELVQKEGVLLEESRQFNLVNGWFYLLEKILQLRESMDACAMPETKRASINHKIEALEKIVALLKSKAEFFDINSVDEYGMTPLAKAANLGQLEVAELLVGKFQAYINPVGCRVALCLAAMAKENSYATCKFLIKHHADISMVDKELGKCFTELAKTRTDLQELITQYASHLTETSLSASAFYRQNSVRRQSSLSGITPEPTEESVETVRSVSCCCRG